MTEGTLSKNPLARIRQSITARIVVLIMATILLAEVVVLIPSLSNFRLAWFKQRVEAAYLVGLALESPYGEMIDSQEAANLFSTADIKGVTLERKGARMLIMAPTVDMKTIRIEHFVNLDAPMPRGLLTAPWATLLSSREGLIRVTGKANYDADGYVDILVSKKDLRRDLQVYTRNILLISFFISSLVGLLVFWRLNRLIVRPVKHLTANMAAFEANPDDTRNILVASSRIDEIGAAERRLAALEERTHSLLSERRRLAALGAGISKISHDLRNILASAQLMSDRLAKSDDPRVKKLSPRLIASLDRAIALSRDTLNYARMEPSALKKEVSPLKKLIEGVFEDSAAMNIEMINHCPDDLFTKIDPTQLYRAIFNLVRNSVDALMAQIEEGVRTAGTITVDAHIDGNTCIINLTDDGPGIPEAALVALFEPFKGSQKPGGSGLGAAIAHEIVKAHGGQLELVRTGPEGSQFRITLPAA